LVTGGNALDPTAFFGMNYLATKINDPNIGSALREQLANLTQDQAVAIAEAMNPRNLGESLYD